MWPLAFITLCKIFSMDSAIFLKYSAYIGPTTSSGLPLIGDVSGMCFMNLVFHVVSGIFYGVQVRGISWAFYLTQVHGCPL